MTQTTRHWELAAHPDGEVTDDDFRIEEYDLPDLKPGQFRVATEYIAFEPAMRGWITGRDTYVSGIQVGDVMRGMGVGVVDASEHEQFVEGTRVVGQLGWCEHVIVNDPRELNLRAVSEDIPPTMPLSLTGTTGLTAYFGMLDVGDVQEGQTVLVSGAAGATGSVASQIAKHVKGASKVVGVAGGPDKCAWLKETARLDGAIDYKALESERAYRDAVNEHFPDGIDLFYDNVGGPILEAALGNLSIGGTIVVCGAISRYDTDNPGPGPRNYTELILRRGRMEGFIVTDYAKRFGEAARDLARWADAGHIAHEVDVQQGFERAPQVFRRLFEGKNRGKQLLKL